MIKILISTAVLLGTVAAWGNDFAVLNNGYFDMNFAYDCDIGFNIVYNSAPISE